MKITIKQVAIKSGFSTATVSRVLAGSKSVVPKTRRKVLNVIDKLNYKPNLIARSLVRGKTETLAIIIPPEHGFARADYFQKLISGITSASVEHSYNVLIKQETAVKNMRLNSTVFPVDGFIVISPTINSPFVKYLEVNKLNAVLVNSRSKYLGYVDLDNVSAGSLVVEHLIKCGRETIAFFGGRRNNLNTLDRLKGYRLALEKNKISYDPSLVFYAGFDQKTAHHKMRELMDSGPLPDAVFCANDLMAMGVICAIKEKGLRVPEDIAVVGFDDIYLSELFDPPVTTVKQPFYEMGRSAVKLLLDQIKNKPGKVNNKEFHGELIIRKSSGYPAVNYIREISGEHKVKNAMTGASESGIPK